MFCVCRRLRSGGDEREDSNRSDIREALITAGQYARIQERKARRA